MAEKNGGEGADCKQESEQNTKAKSLPWINGVYLYSALHYAGNLKGKVVADFACGGGTYTIPFLKAGAKKVICMDSNSAQIEICRQMISFSGFTTDNCEFFTHKATQPKQLGHDKADIGVCINLLVQAKNMLEMTQMCKTFFVNLNDLGKILIITGTVDTSNKANLERCRAMGADFEVVQKKTDTQFEKINLYMGLPRNRSTNVCVIHYNVSVEEVINACKMAGFKNVKAEKAVADPTLGGNVKLLDDLIICSNLHVIIASKT